MSWLSELSEFLWAVINNWAGYTTGGVLVALLWLWGTLRQKPLSQKAALALATTFLLMAFFNAWRQQKHEAANAKTELEKRLTPLIECRFDQWALSSVEGQLDTTYLFVQLALRNRGTPSIVEKWDMSISMPDGTKISGTRRFFPDTTVYALNENLKLYAEDSLFTKDVNVPIATGGRRPGWLLFSFDKPRAYLSDPNAVMTISFDDVDGVTHHSKQSMRGDSGLGGKPLYYPGFSLGEPSPKQNQEK